MEVLEDMEEVKEEKRIRIIPIEKRKCHKGGFDSKPSGRGRNQTEMNKWKIRRKKPPQRMETALSRTGSKRKGQSALV